jgi:hypothetical protein
MSVVGLNFSIKTRDNFNWLICHRFFVLIVVVSEHKLTPEDESHFLVTQ